jgi:hypothetical protein
MSVGQRWREQKKLAHHRQAETPVPLVLAPHPASTLEQAEASVFLALHLDRNVTTAL